MKKRFTLLSFIFVFLLSLCGLSSCSLLLGGAATVIGGMMNGQNNVEIEIPQDGYTTQAVAPKDGTKPTDHTGFENVSYMAYVLAHTNAYHTEAFSTVNTTVAVISYAQKVETYKDYKNGVMVVSDISKSSLVNTALQSCFVGDRVMWRNPSSSNANDWKGTSTQWKDSKPANYSTDDYMKIYGLPSTEFSIYTLNEETLTSWSEVTDNGDGTYSQTIYPDKVKSSGYYAIRMKTMGGLSTYPAFNSISITYTFDENWRVLSSETKENYGIDMGPIHSDSCQAVTKQTYNYNESEVDVSAYENFFKNYVSEQTEGDIEENNKKELTATDYLSSAFGSILVEPKQLSLNVTLEGKSYDAEVYVDIASSDFRVALEGLNVWVADGVVYAQIDENILSLPIEEVMGLLPAEEGGLSLDTDALLKELGQGTITQTETGVTLTTTLTFGDIALPLFFDFAVEDEVITLNEARVDNLELLGTNINLTACFSDKEFLAPIDEDKILSAVDLTGFTTELKDLLNAEAFDFGVAYQTEELSVSASATLNVADLTVRGNYAIVYQDVEVSGTFDYIEGYIYLTIAQNEGLNLKLNVEESWTAILNAIDFGAQEEETETLDILSFVLALDLKDLIPAWSVTETVASLTVNVDGLLADMGVELALGDIELDYELSSGLTASLQGATITAMKGERKEITLGQEYIDLTDVVTTIPELVEFANMQRFDLEGVVTLSLGETDALLELSGDIDVTDGLALYINAKLTALNTEHNIQVLYRENVLTVAYGNVGVAVNVENTEELKTVFMGLIDQITALINGDASKEIEGPIEEPTEAPIEEPTEEPIEEPTGEPTLGDIINEVIASLTLNVTKEDGLKIDLGVLGATITAKLGATAVGVYAEIPFNENLITLDLSAKQSVKTEQSELQGDITCLDENDLTELLTYVSDILNEVEKDAWNITIDGVLTSEDEKYAEWNGVKTTISGEVQIALDGEEVALSATLGIDNNAEDEEDIYFTVAIKDGWLYLSVSYYNDPANENYKPLYLKGELAQLSALIDTVSKLTTYDMPFLKDLLSNFITVGEDVEELVTEEKAIVVSDLFRRIEKSEQGFVLTVNADAVVEEIGEVALTLSRGEEGQKFVVSLSMQGVEVSVALNEEQKEIVVAEADYIDISTLDTVVNSLINSLFTVEDNVLSPMDRYYFAGKLSGSIGGYELDFDLSVNVALEESPVINVSIGADSKFAVNSGKYKTYVTWDIGAGMVYMQRYQYAKYTIIPVWTTLAQPEITYRSMTQDEFVEDYWKQITYITNMGSTVAGLIEDQINKPSDGGTQEVVKRDIGSYVKGYVYDDSGETLKYTATLNGKNFADFLGDMNLTFTTNLDNELTNITGSVNIYITLAVNIDYENVTKAEAGDYTLTVENITDGWTIDGYDRTFMGGHVDNVNELWKVVDFTSEITLVNGEDSWTVPVKYGSAIDLPTYEDTATHLFKGWFTEGNGQGEKVEVNAIDNGLAGQTLYAYWYEIKVFNLTYVDEVNETEENATWKETEDFTALEAPEKDGYIFQGWFVGDNALTKDAILASEGLDVTITAKWKKIRTITINYVDEVAQAPESTAWAINEEFAPAGAQQANGYQFVGWYVQVGEGYQVLSSDSVLSVGEDEVTAIAVWAKTTLTASASGMKKMFGKATITINASSCEIVGLDAGVTTVYKYYFKKLMDAETYENVTAMSKTSSGTYVQSYEVTATFAIIYNGETIGTVTASCKG